MKIMQVHGETNIYVIDVDVEMPVVRLSQCHQLIVSGRVLVSNSHSFQTQNSNLQCYSFKRGKRRRSQVILRTLI